MKKNNDQDGEDGQEPFDLIATSQDDQDGEDCQEPFDLIAKSLYVGELIQWFFSKYPDLEDPKLKRYPGDNRPNGKGIFDNVNEFDLHYCHRLALSDMIEKFSKDVMMRIDSSYSPKEDFEFKIDWEFMEKNIDIVKQLLGIIISNSVMRKNNGV